MGTYRNDREIVKIMQQEIMDDILKIFPDTEVKDRDDLMSILYRICESTSERFVMIIDDRSCQNRSLTSR